jgi:catechol 2,3-dioxygenase-like lactoylglutathione lyase family enzyme
MVDDFLHVSITCRDLERSIRFYETLGLKVIKRLHEVDEDGIARGFGCRRVNSLLLILRHHRQLARCS